MKPASGSQRDSARSLTFLRAKGRLPPQLGHERRPVPPVHGRVVDAVDVSDGVEPQVVLDGRARVTLPLYDRLPTTSNIFTHTVFLLQFCFICFKFVNVQFYLSQFY